MSNSIAKLKAWDARGRQDMDYFKSLCPERVTLLKFERVTEPYNHTRLTALCEVCGHEWNAYAKHVVDRGCPKCSRSGMDTGKKTHAQFVKQLRQINPEIKCRGRYDGAYRKVEVEHVCGHTWSTAPHNLLKGRGCPACKNKLKLSTIKGEYVRGYEPQAIEFIVKNKLAKAEDVQVSGIPYVKYRYAGGWHRYHPDMLIASQNRIVEVKSVGTLGIKSNGTWFKGNGAQLFAKTKAKRKGCIEQGFKFVLMLMNEDGTRINLPRNWYDLTLNQLRAKIARGL